MNARLQQEFESWKAAQPSYDIEVNAQDLRQAAQKFKTLDAKANRDELTAEFVAFLITRQD